MISRKNLQDLYPLSPMQEGMLHHWLLAPDSEVYCEQVTYRLKGTLDLGLFYLSWNHLLKRHDALRTVFVHEKTARPLQMVLREVSIGLYVEDLSDAAPEERAQRIDAYARADRARGFNLTKDLLTRVALFRSGPDEYEILWSFHHIILDGWSVGLLMADWLEHYVAARTGGTMAAAAPIPYSRYIKFLDRIDLRASAQYWSAQLAGYTGVATIPSSRPGPSGPYRASRAEYVLDADETQALNRLARLHGITMAAVVQGLWALVLSRYRHPSRDHVATHDLAFGIVVSGRSAALPDVERMVGLFTNTVPLRVGFREDESVATMLRRVSGQSLTAQEHSLLPLAEIQTRSGMIDHVLAFENYPRDLTLARSIAEGGFAFEVTAVDSFEQTPYNLSVIVNPSGDSLRVCFCFNESFHSPAQIDRLFGQLRAAATAAAANPDAPIGDLDLVSAKEADEIAGFSRRESTEVPNETLPGLAKIATDRAPTSPAILAGSRVFTYADVDQKAGSLASNLLRQHGVQRGERVGVVLERSPELPICALGIMRAGAVYVPIDPVFPPERIAFIARDSDCRVILTTRTRLSSIQDLLPAARVIEAAMLMQEPPKGSSLADLDSKAAPDDCAYVIYTSGSTGAPKGVAIAHRGVVNLMVHLGQQLPVTQADGVVLFASPSFDASIWETWSAWCHGAALVIADPHTVEDPRRFGQFLRRYDCSIALLPPSYAQLVDPDDLSVLKTLVTGGEAARADTARAMSGRVRFINGYGPSEASIQTTAHVVGSPDTLGATVPIGRPIANVDALVLDARGRLAAIGAPGELCLGGVAVGLGYINRPELTAERFPPHPTRQAERIYRTGDLVRWLDEGTLEYVGRSDDQVKVRGYRIEPGEIEARLLSHPQIRQAAVLPIVQDAAVDLVAFVVPVGVADLGAVRAHLRSVLPEYMLPSRFVQLAALPLTPQGKIDRAALTAGETHELTERAPARNALELDLQRIWESVLGVKEIGVYDDFFDSGGHSLKAVRLAARIRKDLGHALDLSDLYRYPTIADLADVLRARKTVVSDAIPRIPDAATYAVSHAQRRLWLLDQMTDAAAYNISGAYVLEGLLDAGALDRAVATLVARHESLRTTFEQVDDEPRQRVHPPPPRSLLERVDVSRTTDPEAAWREVLAASVNRRFDLATGPLLRLTLVALGPTRHVLIIVLHHIVADEWSIGVLTREISALYQAYADRRRDPLPPLPLQHRDVATWQNHRSPAVDREYWHRTLAGPLPLLELPTDRPRPRQRSFAGRTLRYAIDRATSDRLKALARRQGASLSMLLVAAVNALLYRYTGQRDIIVGHPAAGRDHPDLEGQVGFFINTIALRNTVAGDQPFSALLDRVKQTTFEALAHQDYPFDRLVQELGVSRDASRHPVFDVMIAVETPDEEALRLPGILVSPQPAETATSKFDLLFGFSDTARGIEGSIEYASDLFAAATSERLRAHMEILLAGIAQAPDAAVSRLPLLTDAERRLVLPERATRAAEPSGETLVSRFVYAALWHPDRPAVVRGNLSLTYRELDARSNQLARRLIAGGAGPGVVIGVSIDRTPDLIVALLAVLKSGAAYLPLDPNLPPARQSLMLEDAGATVCVTAAMVSSVRERPTDRLATGPRATDLAYVIYTSGSTGRPNGVMVEHRNAVALVDAYDHIAPPPLVLVGTAMCPIGFDVSVGEIFSCLCRGGTLHLLPLEIAGDPDGFVRFLASERVTSAFVSPPLVAPFAAALDRSAEPIVLERVLTGVVPIKQRDLQDWRDRLPRVHITNGYGPTETTVWATFLDFTTATDPESRTPIGRAAHGYRVYLLDADLQPVPIGVHGEIFIGGAGVARGYLNNPALTAQRFVADPFARGDRLYRTGDRARWLPDGTIEFIGRVDHQVKIRGVRVEPGEIAAALETHPGVLEAAVIATELEDGTKRLVAYVATGDAAPLTPAELRAHLQGRLPDVMIPSAFVALPALPRNANGKLDRGRLPAAEMIVDDSEVPTTETERLLAVIWANVLDVERLGRQQNFFDAGGHSLAAMQVVGRVRDACGVDLPLADVFQSPTIAMLATRVDALQRETAPMLPPVQAGGPNGPAPLSFAQQRLWFLDQLEPGPAYNLPIGVRLRGELDVPALERALGAVIARHDVLRTVFTATDGVPAQHVLPEATVSLLVEDFSGYSLDARDAVVQEIAASMAAEAFDLTRELPWRAHLLRLAADDHALLLTIHHIAVDGWSVGVLLGEMAAGYQSERPLPPLALQYADVARWQRQWLDEGVLQPQLDYWRRTLAGLPPALALPTDRPRLAERSRRAGVERFVIDPELTNGLTRLGRTLNATTFMTLLAAFNVLLSRHAGQHDIAVGTPIANRTRAELEPLIGFFANTLVLRTSLHGDPDFAALVRRVRAAALGAYANQDVPFEQLVETLQPERSLDYAPLFQVLFVMQGRQKDIAIPGLEVSPIDQPATTAKFDLTLSIEERDRTLSGSIEYDAGLFDAATIQAMVRHFATLLAAIVENPGVPISRLRLLTPDQRRDVVAASQGPAPGASDARTVLDFFSRQAARTPDATAVEDGERSLTYRELDQRANQVAHFLRRRGAAANVPIGLHVDRSLEQMIALLGILKSGAACLSLDSSYPRERLAFMEADSGAPYIVHRSDVGACRREPTTAPDVAIAENDLLYVLYTSGSTGRPKGVLFPHRILANLVRWGMRDDGFAQPARTLQFAPISFDVSFQEIFTCWASGGTLVLVDEERRRDPEALLEYVRQRSIERLFLPFVALDGFAEAAATCGPGELPAALRQVITAGEQLRSTPALRSLFTRLPGCRLHNHYGPTEAHVVTSYTLAEEPEHWPPLPPIGRPIAGAGIYILDDDLEPVPRGVIGELYIGGPVVADGYLKRPDLTAERFIPDPFSPSGAHLYRTGDYARVLADGNVEFLGRRDGQIKIRGFRVELGEVEAVLARHPSVAQAAVVADDGQRLVAYVVPAGGASSDMAALRKHAREELPAFMIPAAFVALDRLPLTPSGKLDRRALPALSGTGSVEGPALSGVEGPALSGIAGSVEGPRTLTEYRVADIWRGDLGLPAASVHESFFDLGGHSLLAARLASRIRRTFSVALPLKKLFEGPTIAEMAAAVDAATVSDADGPIPRAARVAEMPCSFAQERLWFLSALEGQSGTYNMPSVLRLTGALDIPALEASVREIIRRHEVLRTRLVERDGRVVQVIEAEGVAALPAIDLSDRSAADRDEETRQRIDEFVKRPFDLARELPVRFALLRHGPEDHVLLATLHHIVGDGWSLGVLARELTTLYAAYLRGDASPLPELPIQYADFAVWQRARLTDELLQPHRDYWTKQLEGAPARLELPMAHPRPARQSFRGAVVPFTFDKNGTDRLRDLARRHHVTLYTLLLTAYAAMLYRASGQPDFVIAAPTANRTRPELEPLIGFFVNQLPIRVRCDVQPTIAGLARQLQRTILEAFAREELPFEKVVEDFAPERSLAGQTPLSEIMFVLQNAPRTPLELAGLQITQERFDSFAAKYDLTMSIDETPEGMTGGLEYATDLFDAATAEQMVDAYRRVLASMVESPDAPVLESRPDPVTPPSGDFAFDQV